MKVSDQIEAVKRKIEEQLPELLLSGKESRIIITCKQSKATVQIAQDIKEVWNSKQKRRVYDEHIEENT